MSFVEKLGRAFPRIKPAAQGIAKPTRGLGEVRTSLWNQRAEYWVRRAGEIPGKIPGAKAELKTIGGKLKNPGNLTYRDLAHAGIWGLQIGACFCVGEMIGRGGVLGYPVERNPYSEMH